MFFRPKWLALVFCAGFASQAGAEYRPVDRDLYQHGQQLYAALCAECHGVEGDGQGPRAAEFVPRPRNFQIASFKFRSTALFDAPTAADLARTISRGIEGSYGRSMPAFADLSERDLAGLVEVIRVFGALAEMGAPLAAPARPPVPDLTRGSALYREMRCIDCHGSRGDGNGPLAADLTDGESHPIRPTAFVIGKFKGGSQPEDVWFRIYSGVDGTPMPSFGRNMKAEDIWHLVGFVLSFRTGEVRW